MIIAVLLLAVLPPALGQFYLTVLPDTSTTNTLTNYTFQLTASLPLIPGGTSMRISFPTQYTTSPTSLTCTTVYWVGAPSTLSCAYGANILTISDGFPSDLSNQYTFQFKVGNILNPLPAGTTSSFVVSFVYPNGTVQSSTGTYAASITEGQATCAKTISNALVNAMGVVTVNFTPKNVISNGSTVFLSVAMNKTYGDTTNTDIAASIAGSTVVGTYRFNFTMLSPFNISMLMPFSTQPVANFITITSYISTGTIDTCQLTIDGVSPNTFTAMAISSGRVQTTSSMSFNFINLSPILVSDQLVVTFPTDFNLSGIGTTVSMVRGTLGTRNITVASNVVTIWNVTTSNSLIKLNTTFLFSNVILPFSTKSTQITVTSQTNTGYLKDSSTVTYSATMGALSGISAVCDVSQLGYAAVCTFSFTLQSSLTNSGHITLSFPADFSITGGNYQCLTTGTDSIRSNCTNYVGNNSILVSNMTAGNLVANTALTIRLNLTLPATPATYSINISSWCPGIVDSGIASLTILSRQLLSSEFSVSSSSQLTYSSTTYNFVLTLPVTPTSVSLVALITIPVDSQGVLSCNNGTVLSSFNNPTLQLALPSPLVPLNVSGLLTPFSTSPISISLQVVSSSNLSFVYYYISGLKLQVSSPRAIDFLMSTQTSTTVFTPTNLTVTLSGLQTQTIVTITGATYNGSCSAGSNITGVLCTKVTNGVQVNITTDGVDSSSARRYSFSVLVITPAYIGTQQLQVNTLTSDTLYQISTGSTSILSNTMNTLSISFTQSAPYFRQNSTYTVSLNASTPNCTYLNLTLPSSYTFINASGLSSSLFIQSDGSTLMFSLDSYLNVNFQVTLTNPDTYTSIFLKTYSNRGDIDSGVFLPVNPCLSSCRSCSADKTTCTSCYSWAAENKLDNGSCVSGCPNAKYFNGTSCVQCTGSCINCSSATNCFGCDTGLILFNNSCLTVCPNGYYVSGSTCQACSAACKICDSLTNCSVCATGYSLYNNSCLGNCPGATYSLNNICYNCSSGCLTCTSLSCTLCNSSMLLFNGGCLNACPDGLFMDGSRNCVSCQSPCATCVNTSTTCLSCVSGTYLMVQSCLSSCPSTYYMNLTNSICSQCGSPCLTCSSLTVCVSCLPGYYFYQNKCTTSCPSGSYPSDPSTCSSCVSPCLTCTGLSSCTSCASNLILFNLTCSVECPSTYYNSSGVCAQCVSPCLTCQTSTICLSCSIGSLFNRSCVAVCPSTHYSLNNVCTNCVSPCANCEGTGTTCIGCVTGYSLHGTTCVTNCPDRFYTLEGVCVPCQSPCLNCNSSISCLSCNKTSTYPYYAASQLNCVAVCSGGLHLNSAAMICEACQAPCITCLESTQCLSCTSGMILNGTSCISNCPAGYYNLSSNCVQCPQYCQTCQLRNSVVCLDCQTNTYFFGNYCVASCPQNTTLKYGYCMSHTCQQSNCIRCSNQNCLQCSAYYTLSDNTCTLNISPNNYIDNIKQGNIVPFPFLGGAILVIIILAAVRFQFSSMYLPISLYSWIGLLEVGALILWASFTISSYQFQSYGILAIAILALYIIFNLVNLLCYSAIKKDRKYKIWLADHCCGNTAILIISSLLSFRFCRVQFSKLGNWQIFHARLSNTSAYIPYNVLTAFSMVCISVFAIIVCGIVSYQQTSMNQVFFSSIEVVLLEVMLLFVSLAEMIKPKGYLLENAGDYAHGNDIDSMKIQSMKCINEDVNSVSGAEMDEGKGIGSAMHSEGQHQNEGSDDIVFQEEEPEDLQAGNPSDNSNIGLTSKKLFRGNPDSANTNGGNRDDQQESQNGNPLKTRPTSPLHVAVPNECIFQTPIETLQAQKSLLEEKLREQMQRAKIELESQLEQEQIKRKEEQERREQQIQQALQEARRKQQQQIQEAKRRTETEQARIMKIEEQIKIKEEQERELRMKLKKLEDEEEQERRNSLKQHREWQLMDIEDHLSREREFRDRLAKQRNRGDNEENIEERMNSIKQLAELKMELYRTDEKQHGKSFGKRKKRQRANSPPLNQVLIHNPSLSDLSDNSNHKSKKSLKGRSDSAGTKSNQEFIAQFDEKQLTNNSQKVTRVSDLNRAGSKSRNLKTIQQQQLRQQLRQDQERYDKNKVHKMLENAQKKMNNYLSSMADPDYETIGSEDLPRQIKHDASMPLPSGKLDMKSSRSFKQVGRSLQTQQITVGPIAEEDEGRYTINPDMSEALLPNSIDIEDPRSSIHHMVSKRKNISLSGVPVKVRTRQTLRTSSKDLETERIYLQRLSVDRSPQRSSKIFEAVGRDSLGLSQRRNTSSDWKQIKENHRYGQRVDD